jgi:hypothetical protein
MVPLITLLLADAGVPMIFLTFPAMAVLLLPIVFLEAWLFRKWLGLETWTAVKSSALANLGSNLIGVPAAWAVMLGFEFGVGWGILKIPALNRMADNWHSPIATAVSALLSAAWLGPDEKNLYWMIPVAVLGLMVPTFFASVWIETFIVEQMVGTPEEDSTSLTSISHPERGARRKSSEL